MTEVVVLGEGALRYVQPSGGLPMSWATASAAPSGLFGFVKSMRLTSAQKLATIINRDTPDHHKWVGAEPIELEVEFLSTGGWPSASASNGASVPYWLMEHRAFVPNSANGSAVWHQFYGCYLEEGSFAEAEEGNTLTYRFKLLGYVGPTASGRIF